MNALSSEILTALTDYASLEDTSKPIPETLENLLVSIAKTGQTKCPWEQLKPLLCHKLESTLKEFCRPKEDVQEDTSSENIANQSHSDGDSSMEGSNHKSFTDTEESILGRLKSFKGAPFTIQRLCELVTSPRKHYSTPTKLIRGIEKTIMVVTTVDQFGRKECSNNRPPLPTAAIANGLDSTYVMSSPTMATHQDDLPSDCASSASASSDSMEDATSSSPMSSVSSCAATWPSTVSSGYSLMSFTSTAMAVASADAHPTIIGPMPLDQPQIHPVSTGDSVSNAVTMETTPVSEAATVLHSDSDKSESDMASEGTVSYSQGNPVSDEGNPVSDVGNPVSDEGNPVSDVPQTETQTNVADKPSAGAEDISSNTPDISGQTESEILSGDVAAFLSSTSGLPAHKLNESDIMSNTPVNAASTSTSCETSKLPSVDSTGSNFQSANAEGSEPTSEGEQSPLKPAEERKGSYLRQMGVSGDEPDLLDDIDTESKGCEKPESESSSVAENIPSDVIESEPSSCKQEAASTTPSDQNTSPTTVSSSSPKTEPSSSEDGLIVTASVPHLDDTNDVSDSQDQVKPVPMENEGCDTNDDTPVTSSPDNQVTSSPGNQVTLSPGNQVPVTSGSESGSTEVVGSATEVVGSATEVVGSATEVVGSATEVVGWAGAMGDTAGVTGDHDISEARRSLKRAASPTSDEENWVPAKRVCTPPDSELPGCYGDSPTAAQTLGQDSSVTETNETSEDMLSGKVQSLNMKRTPFEWK